MKGPVDQTSGGREMDIETIGIIGLIGFACAAATLGRIVYERHLDVLYGPYIEGRNKHPRLGSVLKPLHR
jgi:hypothetical protein